MSNLGEIGEPRVGGLSGIFLWTGVLIFRSWRGLGALHPALSALGILYSVSMYLCYDCYYCNSFNQLCIHIINFVLDAKPFTAEMNTKERRSEIFMSSYSVCLEYLLRNYHCEPQPPT